MKYDFDKIIDRSGSGDLKHEVLKARYGRDDLIALWVADMDFETPAFILDAIKSRLHHPIVGYTVEPSEYWPTVSRWIADHHGWNVKLEWMTYVPGVVKGIGMAINALTQPGDRILIPHGCKVLRGQGPRRGEVDGQVIPMELLQLQLLQLLQKGGISYNSFLKTL